MSIIERVVAEVNPTVVYTHSQHDRHQDHRAVHQASSVATRRVQTFACYQSPSATVDFRPNRFVPVDGFLDTKLAQLACFSTPVGDPGLPGAGFRAGYPRGTGPGSAVPSTASRSRFSGTPVG